MTQTNKTAEQFPKLLRIKQVEQMTTWHRQTIWRKTKAGIFPAPRKLGTLNVWLETEVIEFLNRATGGQAQSAHP